MKIYRHGDVLISPVDAIPEDVRKRSDLVLAMGEVTGHAHAVETADFAELYEGTSAVSQSARASAEVLFLRVVGGPARVVHPEHNTIQLPIGLYRVWRQREYDPWTVERTIED